jgi:hypothetical protein
MSSDESQGDPKAAVTDYNEPFKCKPEDLKEGEWLSGTIYYKVGKAIGSCHEITDSFGRKLSVGNTILHNEMISASQFDTEVKVTRTEMVEILLHAGEAVFTIKFRKQLTGKDVNGILDDEKYDTQPAAKRIKLCNQAIKAGEPRYLTGYIRNTEHAMGRTNVIDLALENSPHNTRQVDHRTLEELILKRVKYTLKK